MQQDNRYTQRINFSHPIQISFGSQFALQGQVRDISLKSVFVLIRSTSIHMAMNDKLTFIIDNVPNIGAIKGSARISRIAPGEGIAIYFIEMDSDSTHRLQRLIGTAA
jgi:hypothetical protein